jgi:hypothetical protein
MDAFPPCIERRPVVENGFVVEHEVVVTPDHPRGVWVVDGVPLAALHKTLLADDPPADAGRLAEIFGRPRDSIELAQQWLKDRLLITD